MAAETQRHGVTTFGARGTKRGVARSGRHLYLAHFGRARHSGLPTLIRHGGGQLPHGDRITRVRIRGESAGNEEPWHWKWRGVAG